MSGNSIASLGLGIVGAALTPFNPALGFSLGASIGSALVPPELPDINSPISNDLGVTASTYGAAIPIVYGTQRVACSMIWVDPDGKRATQHSQTAGGKGGPTQTSTWYTYSLTAAYAICAREIISVRRIWLNGKLMYDWSDDTSALSLIASNKLANGVNIFTGSETQLASAVQEGLEGVGNVPAYRGLAYIEFDQLQLQEFGNGTVNVEVEVVAAGAVTAPPVKMNDWYANVPQTTWKAKKGTKHDEGTILQVNPVPHATSSIVDTEVYRMDMDGYVLNKEVFRVTTLPDCPISSISYGICKNDPYFLRVSRATPCVDEHYFFYKGVQTGKVSVALGNNIDALGNTIPSQGFAAIDETIRIGDYFICSVTKTGSGSGIQGLIRYPVDNKGGPAFISDASVIFADVWNTALGVMYNVKVTADQDGQTFWTQYGTSTPTSNDDYLVHWDVDLNILGKWSKDVQSIPNVGANHDYLIDSNAGIAMYSGNASDFTIYLVSFDPDAPDTDFVTIGTASASLTTWDSLAPLTPTVGIHGDGVWTTENLVSRNAETLSSIVTDICTRVGLTAGDLDVTALTDSVNGFVIGQTATARRAIEPLMQTFIFDGAEVDGKIKFTKRGGASVKTISADDLAAHDLGGQPPESEEIVRTHDTEIPRRVTLAYQNWDNNYHPAEQHADRLTVSSEGIQNISVPIVLTDDEAATLVHKILYLTWAGREKITISLSNKYAELVAGDVITVGDTGHRVRINSIDNDLAGVIKATGTIEYLGAYSGTAVGASSTAYGSAPAPVGPTDLRLLDVPIFRDIDDDAGFYIAMAGYLDGWNGGSLYKSIDDGATFTLVDGMTVAATMGSATDALPDAADTTTWDSTVTVNVDVGQGVLASDTQANVLEGANMAVLKSGTAWEVIQWTTATLEADGTYTLSNLLRGRRGTEHATADHSVGDSFVLITSTTSKRIAGATSDLDLTGANPKQYKGVSIGNIVQNASALYFSNTGVGLKPFSVAALVATRTASINVSWLRRSRLFYYPTMVIPLGEETEEYDVEYWDMDATPFIIVTKTVTSESSTLTTADVSPLPASVKAVVYQNSAIVGNGYPNEVTV